MGTSKKKKNTSRPICPVCRSAFVLTAHMPLFVSNDKRALNNIHSSCCRISANQQNWDGTRL